MFYTSLFRCFRRVVDSVGDEDALTAQDLFVGSSQCVLAASDEALDIKVTGAIGDGLGRGVASVSSAST